MRMYYLNVPKIKKALPVGLLFGLVTLLLTAALLKPTGIQ